MVKAGGGVTAAPAGGSVTLRRKAVKFVTDAKTGKIKGKAVQKDFDDTLDTVYEAAIDDALQELVTHLLENPAKVFAVLKVAKGDVHKKREAKDPSSMLHNTLIRLGSVPKKFLGGLLQSWYPVLTDARLKAPDKSEEAGDGIYKAFYYECGVSSSDPIPPGCHTKQVFEETFYARRITLGKPMQDVEWTTQGGIAWASSGMFRWGKIEAGRVVTIKHKSGDEAAVPDDYVVKTGTWKFVDNHSLECTLDSRLSCLRVLELFTKKPAWDDTETRDTTLAGIARKACKVLNLDVPPKGAAKSDASEEAESDVEKGALKLKPIAAPPPKRTKKVVMVKR